MRYRVTHTTSYRYADPVDLASHMLHLKPRVLAHQRVLSAALSAEPAPSRVVDGLDHFGNGVAWMFLDLPHDRFEVTTEARIDVAFPRPPEPAATLPWEEVRQSAQRGGRDAWEAAEFSFHSPMAPPDAGAAAYAEASFPPARPVLEGLLELNRRIRREFAFKSGVTTLYTPVSRILAQRAGVCQDFTHLMLTGLRGLGLPARYVSGYIRTHPRPGTPARRGTDQSHAWVSAWLGPEHGWVDLDPTNDVVVSEEHIVLAWGRDYGDISPVRGILLGGARHTVSVGVDLQPADP